MKFLSKVNICFHVKSFSHLFSGDAQNLQKEDRCLSLSMPVITEEDEENGSHSEAGRDESLSDC